MNAVALRHEQRDLPGKARLPGEPRSWHLWRTAFWLTGLISILALGFAIGAWLESGLLGFVGADFVFLVIMSFYTSGQRGASGRRV